MSYEDETHHCGAKPGQPHRFWDDVARCYWTGIQLIQCGSHPDDVAEDPDIAEAYRNRDHDCMPSIWDGDYPGVKQCQKYGLYVYDFPGIPGKSEDLNTLGRYGKWNVETQQNEIDEKTLARLLTPQ